MKRVIVLRLVVRFMGVLCLIACSVLHGRAQDTWTWPEKPKNLQVLRRQAREHVVPHLPPRPSAAHDAR